MADKDPRYRSFRTIWRLLAVGGIAIGISAMFGPRKQRITATGHHTAWPGEDSLQADYEVKDINVRGVSYILLGLAVTLVVVVGVVFVTVWRFDVSRRQAWSQLTPEETARIVPPAPHLQRDPFADLARVRAREHRLLHSYGWTSADHSTARIPIDRAMALVEGKSLDVSP
jgi:hypothetical protein